MSRRSRRPATWFSHSIAEAAVVAFVTATTFAEHAGAFSAGSLSASPQRIAHGKLWLLVTNAGLVQRPVALSLFAFVVLIFFTPYYCGTRVFVIAAVVGHVGSTLLSYALVGSVHLVDAHAVRDVVAYPDYGVSAIQAAWIGAIAATAWRRHPMIRSRLLVVAGCLAVTAIAVSVRSDLTLLDTDHVFAFAIGAAALSSRPWGSRSRSSSLQPGITRFRSRLSGTTSPRSASTTS